MKYHLFFIFTITHVVLFSQITVSNSNYLFVDDNCLYVENNIDLVTTDSHIYLRNAGQLFQGGNGTNTGLGSLSVYQNNNVNAYSYNYWCSPVGSNGIENTVNNAFVPNLLGDPDVSEGIIDYVPAGFTDALEGSCSPLIISKQWIWTYELGENSIFDWNFIGSNGDVSPGLGFTMKGTKGSNNNQQYEFRGKPNTGTIDNIVMEEQFILIGNPYPSGLDARSFIHDPENVNAIDGTLYFWEQDLEVGSHYSSDYVGGYATYTITSDGNLETFVPAPFESHNGEESGHETGIKSVTRYLTIGQGFMVRGNVGTSGIVKTKNSHRSYTNRLQTPSYFFKNSKKTKSLPLEYMRFKLNVNFNDAYTRQLVYNFNENASEGFDYGMECFRQDVMNNDAYWIQKEKFLVAQASVFDEYSKIPIIVKLTTNSSVDFKLFDLENFKNLEYIYLFDKQLNKHYDLLSKNAILNLESGDYFDRFEIQLKSETFSIEDTNTSDSSLFAYFNNSAKTINLSNKNLKVIHKLFLYNISGLEILNRDVHIQNELVQIPVTNLTAGVYFLRCVTNTNTEILKLLIK